MEAVRAEFEARLAAADRKVYALSTERDALRRGNEKLGTVTDLLKEKDAIISQARPLLSSHLRGLWEKGRERLV